MPILRRKRSFIDFEVQTSLLRRMTLQWISFLVVNAIALYCWTYLLSGAEAPLGIACQPIRSTLFACTFCILGAFACLLVGRSQAEQSFRRSDHAGRKTLADAAQGTAVAPLKFRENDFWRSLADDLNVALKLEPSRVPSEEKVS